jgi:polar amino acid transport system permease protein
MSLDFSWLADPLYQQWLVRGIGNTLLMSLLGIVMMFAVGIAGAICMHFRLPVLETLTTILVELFRNTPPLVQLFFLYFMLSEIGLTSRTLSPGATCRSSPASPASCCRSASTTAPIAVEIIRSGLLAVPSQTVEGARSLGYSRLKTFRHVELPIGCASACRQ